MNEASLLHSDILLAPVLLGVPWILFLVFQINLPIYYLSFRSSQNSVPSTVISQDFFTCPNSPQDEQQTPFASTSVSASRNFERLSPSPEKEINYVVTTNTDYPWTSIEELLLNEDESVASFRLHGYIREILPVPWVLHAKRNWKQSLAMVCKVEKI